MSNREVYHSKKHYSDDHDDFEKNINIAKVDKSGNSHVKINVDNEFDTEFDEEEDKKK